MIFYNSDNKKVINLDQLENTNRLKIVDMQVDSIIPSIMRHIIKRYLKKVSIRDIKVEHRLGDSPFVLRLEVTGLVVGPLTKEQEYKINYLNQIVENVLNSAASNGKRASDVDPEKLRILLSKEEPSMKKIYYKVR